MLKNKFYVGFAVLAILNAGQCYAALKDSRETKNEVQINFDVEVLQQACDVYVGQPMSTSPKIHLGTFSNKKDSKGPLIPLFFQFKNCNVNSVASIEYNSDVGNNKNKGVPSQGTLSTSNDNVMIHFYTDDSASQAFHQKQFGGGHKIDPNEMIPVCFARAEVENNNAIPNKFEGKALFTITYN